MGKYLTNKTNKRERGQATYWLEEGLFNMQQARNKLRLKKQYSHVSGRGKATWDLQRG